MEEAYFHVTQFRGFEKFCEGRPFYEMPSLMARICGICPVSHLIASAKACDAILAVRIPANAVRLRTHPQPGADCAIARAQLLLPLVARPAARHGCRPRHAQHLRRDGGQPGDGPGRHPPAAVRPADHRMAGRQAHPSGLGGAGRRQRAARPPRIATASWPGIPEALAIAARTLDWFKSEMERFREEIRTFANFPTLFMGLVGDGRRPRTLRRQAALPGRRRPHRRGRHRRRRLRRLHRRDRASLDLPQDQLSTSRWATPMASTAWVRWRA